MKYINKILIALVLIFSSFFIGENLLIAKMAFAESETPSYYSVKKEMWSEEDDEFKENPNDPKFEDGSAILLKSNERVSVALGKDTIETKYSELIRGLTYTITINGTLYTDTQADAMKSIGLKITLGEGGAFRLDIDPEQAEENSGEFIYGRYQLNFTYTYYEDGVNGEIVSFTSSMYILSYEDYNSFFNTNNMSPVNSAYYSNYSTKDIPYFYYNYKNFNLQIAKLYKGLTSITTISYNGNINISSTNESGASTSIHNVSVVTLEKEGKAYITLKDLGVYYLTFTPINPNGENEIITKFYKDNITANLSKIINIYGFQAKYTDQTGLIDFKKTKSDNLVVDGSGVITSAPWQIESTKHSADITSYLQGTTDVIGKLKEEFGTLDKIAKTNQAPIYFDTNATLVMVGGEEDEKTYKSQYYYFKDLSAFNAATSLPDETDTTEASYIVKDYDGAPLSKTGIYLVELVYSFGTNITEATQYFLFRLTNDAPKVDIYTKDDKTENIKNLNNNEYTYKDVYISKSKLDVFDSLSTLFVYKDSSFNGNFDAGVEIDDEQETTFTETARYKVELRYGSDGKKGFVSYFVIDKEEIQEIKFTSLNKTMGALYTLGNPLDDSYVTNQAFALSWKPKLSGAEVIVEYKFFPTTYSSEYANKLTSSELKALYESNQHKYSIPSTHILNYTGGEVPIDHYSNTYGQTQILESEALSRGGLYIFQMYDITGNDKKMFSVFVDTTPNTILTTDGSSYNIVKNSDVSTENVEVLFGKNKYIKVLSTTINDEWLQGYLTSNNSGEYKNQTYLKVGINNKVYYTKDAEHVLSETLSESSGKKGYSIVLNANDSKDSQYIFYSICASTNINYEDSINYYKENYTASYSVRFTTDNSKMNIYYLNGENYMEGLDQLPVTSSTGNKTHYFQPESNNFDVLYFTYSVKPKADLEVKSVVVNYYAFEENEKNSSLEFKKTPTSTVTLFLDGVLLYGEELSGNFGSYIYNINTETFDASSVRTKAGKYEIIRSYTEESITTENDPKERKFIFIVDRNGLIEEPVISYDGTSTYYVGSGIQLQVLGTFGQNYYNTNEAENLLYYDIYYATKLAQTAFAPVLTTNLLPVTPYIPAYKYGHIENKDGFPTFVREDSIGQYKDNDGLNKYYSNYELSAYVNHYSTNNINNLVGTINFNKVNAYGFLTTDDTKSGEMTSFTEQGYYQVVIRSNGGDEFSYIFRIDYAKPEYQLLDSGNTAINKDSAGIYYTSKDVVRISWEDSPNKYLARINKNAISLNINGQNYLLDTSDPNVIKQSGENKYYTDIDLKNIKTKTNDVIDAFYNDSKIDITLQYNGSSENYNNDEYFSKTTKLIIDLQAPDKNIKRLIGGTGLYENDLREYSEGNRYYHSKKSGNLKNFAYTVDISNFNEFIDPAGEERDYYTVYYRLLGKNGTNIKYTGVAKDIETDITISGFDGQMDGVIGGGTGNTSFQNQILDNYENINTYIEIIEEDYAGNRTVYTIYLTDIANNAQENAFTYKKLSQSSSEDEDKFSSVKVSELSGSNISLYSKRSFNLESIDLIKNDEIGSLYWQIITVGSTKYIKSPYKSTYFKYNSKDTTEYTLQELSKLEPSANSQKIELNMVPLYGSISLDVFVLNKTLEYYTLSQAKKDNSLEGIIIKLPNINEEENNVLFAKSLEITGTIGDYVIDGDYLRQEKETLPQINSMSLSYMNYNSDRYLCVQITNYIAPNDYFIYTIEDNFGEIYPALVHIYGQTEITDPIISKDHVAESYNEDGSIVYYSSEDIEYKFDTTIYEKVQLAINLSANNVDKVEYVIEKSDGEFKVHNESNKTVNKEEYEKYIKLTMYSNVVLGITMIQSDIDFSANKLGGCRMFALELIAKEVFNIDSKIVNFEIFNQLPETLKLISKASATDVTSILNGNVSYAGEIVTSYSYSKLAHNYEIVIMYPDGRVELLLDEMAISEDGTYTITINYLDELKGCTKSFNFTIANSSINAYTVAVKQLDGTYKTITATGESFTYSKGAVQKTISTHFIVNDEYEIILNSNLYLEKFIIAEATSVDGYTTIYKITNIGTKEAQNGLISEFYSTQIAISVIPKSNNFLSRLAYYGVNVKEDTTDLIGLANPVITPYVTSKDEYNSGARIAWSKYNTIPENKIIAEVYYGDIDGSKFNAKIENINNLNAINLKTSGTYYIKFVDLAGNHQLFGSYIDNEYFTIRYLSSVIFEVENETPINYAIYDKPININIPESTLSYYDVNSKPIISVELNGEKYNGYEKVEKYSWNFSAPGLYKVWFSAKIDENAIYEAPLFFTILSSKESRISYNYSNYADYYIEDIKLNGESKNDVLANINSGDVFVIDGKNYLKSLTLHANDIKTGVGSWTFVINTNNEFNQKFEFTIWINKPNVPILLSIANGATTTDTIRVSFNTQNLLDETGDCILKITGYEDFVISQEKLENGDIEQMYEFSLTESGGYYIEITTLSGQLLYSSYVTKNEPLNTVSIIIIVVVSVVVIAGVILFILLRRKMKIR